jgi:hypothetical protein
VCLPLKFSADGTSIRVALRDGHAMKVFKLKLSPHTVTPSVNDERGEIEYQRSTATQVYNLHRGWTSAIIESIGQRTDDMLGWAETVHVYAVNPYGGKSDLRSHLEGRIRSVEAVVRNISSLFHPFHLELLRILQ